MTMILRAAELNENIVKLRKRSRLSQYELVAKMQLLGSSMSRSTYAKIERGERNIKATDLVCLSKIYHVGFSEFFRDVGTH